MRLLSLLISVLLFTACQSSKPATGQAAKGDNVSLYGTRWEVVTLIGADKIVSAREGQQPYMTLEDNAQHAVKGFLGCNGFGSSYTITGKGKIKFGPALSTKMYCEEAAATENSFLKALDSVDSYKLNNGELTLYNNGSRLAVFRAEK